MDCIEEEVSQVISGERFQELVEEAGEAFWRVVVSAFPEATAGDFDAEDTFRFEQACGEAIKKWIFWNVCVDRS